MHSFPRTVLATALAAALIVPAVANDRHDEASAAANPTRLLLPMMKSEKGKDVFVSKGCVACHAVNGVGGHDAPPMDDHARLGAVSPFDFAAKMWNHAPGMIAAQEEAFGEQIYFTGEELADIIVFVHADAAQHRFTEADLTASARKMLPH